jgi:formylglycine-generating enzyme
MGALLATNAAAGEVAKRAPEHKHNYEWRLIDGKHWQVVGPEGEKPEETDAREGGRGKCKPGMVEVKGKFKELPNGGDYFQQGACKRWLNRDFPERCAEFDQEKWKALIAPLPTTDMHFCMDRYEYPNRKGENPIILIDWNEAGAICKNQGKRLCTEDEWTFACEGEEALPYPYGYVRDAEACQVDKKWRMFFGGFLRGNPEAVAINELDYLWQGLPSGSKPKCKSPFGIFDMTGNVDEWTLSSRPGRRSILKGGYWGPVRTRCRPSTRAHGEDHAFYQQSVRCCAGVP